MLLRLRLRPSWLRLQSRQHLQFLGSKVLTVLWFIAGAILVTNILIAKGIKKMQTITDALATLTTAITNLQSRAGGVVSQAQADSIASSIRQAASTLDSILPAAPTT